MKNLKLFLSLSLLLAVVVFSVSCDTASNIVSPLDSSNSVSSTAPAPVSKSSAITYDIYLVDSEYNESSNTTTFTYSVTSNPDGGPAISHWMLLFSEACASSVEVVDSNDPTADYGPDGSTGYDGLKFDTGYNDEEARTVELVLAGQWSTGGIDILVKSGNGFVLGSAVGPICGDVTEPKNPEEEQTYTVSGSVFFDENKNAFNDSEVGISSIIVQLYDENGVLEDQTVTDQFGAYEFTEIPAGNYTVVVDPDGTLDGLTSTTGESLFATVVNTDVENIDFGYELPEVSGKVYLDIVDKGQLNPDEAGVPGVVVTLYDDNGNQIGSTVTDENGNYSFEVYPGDYTVEFQEVEGLNFTTPPQVNVNVDYADNPNNNAGLELDFGYIASSSADGYTIGFWKNNISKALQGKIKGTQIDGNLLISYASDLSNFALSPLNIADLNEAYEILNAKGSDDVLLLSKQLLGSEFNYENGAYIGGNELVTYLFVYYGEYLVKYADSFSRSQLLEAKDWFDAYNNSHGGTVALL